MAGALQPEQDHLSQKMTMLPNQPQSSPEAVIYPALSVIDVQAEGQASTADYRNVVLIRINESCLRLASFVGEYRWHHHPTSDELFLVVAGQLEIDLSDGRTLILQPWQAVTIPAGTIHRTRAVGRTVNLCFEQLVSETLFVER